MKFVKKLKSVRKWTGSNKKMGKHNGRKGKGMEKI